MSRVTLAFLAVSRSGWHRFLAILLAGACPATAVHAGEIAPVQTVVAAPTEEAAPAPPIHDKLLAQNGNRPDPNAPGARNELAAAPTTAEQITRLGRSIAQDEERLRKLQQESDNPMSEYRLAEAAFKEVDDEYAKCKAKLDFLDDDAESPEVRQLQEALDALGKNRDLARQRFDLAIESRKTTKDKLIALEAKLREDRAALARLTGEGQTDAAAAPTIAPAATEPPTPPQSAPMPTSANVTPPATVEAASAVAPVATPMQQFAAAPAASAPVAETSPLAAADTATSQEVVDAQQEVETTKAEADVAETEAKSVADRIAIVNKNIALETRLLESSRKQADIALQTRDAVAAEHEKLASEGASIEKLQQLAKRRRESDEFFRNSRRDARDHSDRLSQLQTQLSELQRDELIALAAADDKRQVAEEAESKLSDLQNPFSLHNMLQWLLDHGPRLVGILLAMGAIHWFVRFASLRAVGVMVRRGARGSRADREDRAKTLVSVFHNAVTITVVVGGVLMICEELGIAVGPLMGGAAVFGLAVAFGAQNLIRDYFYGFVILLENQYTLNDVLRIGDTAGQVEQITLRMTVLRDLEGHVHFIPNGKIESVTNMTHGWSRALFDIGVAYKEDVDRVMDVLMELAQDLRRDPAFAPLILDDAEMLGVDAFGDSAVTIRFILKTRPLKQWTVKRELLRRIKRRFDELGIEIPFPQRTVYHRVENDAAQFVDHVASRAFSRKSA